MTDTSITSHEAGRAGRPLSPAKRRARLRMHYIQQIGLDHIDPPTSEAILAAVELTCMAAEQRAKVTKHGAASAEDLLALQLHFSVTSESMGNHDSGDHGWLEHRLRRRLNCGHLHYGM